MKGRQWLHVIVVCALLLPGPASVEVRADPGVLYVKLSATGSGDCGSWENACELQTALGQATAGDEIWVASGTHTPGAERGDTFQLMSGVGVYGGFAGGEVARDDRDWMANVTTLSGNIGTPGDNGDNVYHVVYSQGVTETTVLDGFSITDGNAGDADGDHGGGMYNEGGSPTLTNLTFSGNNAFRGGGMYNDDSSPELVNVVFTGNSATGWGGGLCNLGSSTPNLTFVTFSNNGAANGGGMYNNVAGIPTIQNSILWGNTADNGGQILNASGSAVPSIRHSDIEGSGGSGPGWHLDLGTDRGNNVDADPQFVNADGADGIAGTSDDDLRLSLCSAAIDGGCEYDPGDGYRCVPPGVTTDRDGNPRFRNWDYDMGAYEFQPDWVIYVDADAAGASDGASWENAFANLQDALTCAQTGRIFHAPEIWVAEGIYYPDVGDGQSDNDRASTFQLATNVRIYGGFAGVESARNDRDWEAHVTVLSGDIDSNDIADANGVTVDAADIRGNNSYHVVSGGGYHQSTDGYVMDGFTITGGNADTGSGDQICGGGVVNSGGDPALRNCSITGNSAVGDGGGMHSDDSRPNLDNCSFSGNSSGDDGGGMYSYDGDVDLWSCRFTANTAGGDGGGMYNEDCNTDLSRCTFSDNQAGSSGGGIYCQQSELQVDRSNFTGNDADRGGGVYNENSYAWLYDLTFIDNAALDGDGGGMYNRGGWLLLYGAAFLGNVASGDGGGICNQDSDLAYEVELASALFTGNRAHGGNGGAIHNQNSRLYMTNGTFGGNSAQSGGGICHLNSPSGELEIWNSILWGNTATSGAPIEDQQVEIDQINPPTSFDNTLVQGGCPTYGSCSHLLWVDPEFVDADGEDNVPGTPDDDLHLQFRSPAIDYGDNSALPDSYRAYIDVDRNSRFYADVNLDGEPDDDAPVDAGAYEAQEWTWAMNFGNGFLDEGREYRTGYHDPAAGRTISQTIADYDGDMFLDADTAFAKALEYADTQERLVQTAVGRLDAAWELATGEMLVANDVVVQALDPRISGAYPTLSKQIEYLTAARTHYTRAGEKYRGLLAGALHTPIMDLQRGNPIPRSNPLDPGESVPYLDVQRLAEASAKNSRAYLELGERYLRQYTAESRNEAENTLREGFDVARADLALLAHLARDWDCAVDDPACQPYWTAYQALTQDLADMQRVFSLLAEGKNPFGYDENYVPFKIRYDNDTDPEWVSNFQNVFDLAYCEEGTNCAFRDTEREQGDLLATQRLLDDDDEELEAALGDLEERYADRLGVLCGYQQDTLDYEGCRNGEIALQVDRVGAAKLRVERVQQQMANQLALIRIEQQRAARVAGIHRATAVMYDETGRELADLARKEVELERAKSALGGFFDILGGGMSGFSAGSSFGPEGAIIGAGLGMIVSAGQMYDQNETAEDLADVAERKAEIEAYQKSYVAYAEADIEDANSEALVKEYMLEFALLDLDLAIALNELRQEIARLNGMKTEVEYLLARWAQAKRDAFELYTDPAARIFRDRQAEIASEYFERGLESAYKAGRALDYEVAEDWQDADEVYGIVAVTGSDSLQAHLISMYDEYIQWLPANQLVQYTPLRMSKALGYVDSVEIIGGEPVTTTAEQKFNRYVSDPENWIDLYPLPDGDGVPESLRLTFQTSIFDVSPEHNVFSTGVYNDKIMRYGVVLWGDEARLDGNHDDTLIRLRQDGTCYLRAKDAWGGGEDSFRAYPFANVYEAGDPTTALVQTSWMNLLRPTNHQIDQEGTLGLLWRSVGCTDWVLTIAKGVDPSNDDLDFEALEDVVLWIKHRSFGLDVGSAGSTGSSAPGAGSRESLLARLSPVDGARAGAPALRLVQAAGNPDAAHRFAGTVVPEQPERLPELYLGLYLEETAGSIEGAIESDALVGYPVDATTGLGPRLSGTVEDGKFMLVSDPFAGAGGGITHQVMLTTTVVDDTKISGEYVEFIGGLSPGVVEIRGVFTLTESFDEPVAGFSASPSTGPVPVTVAFTDWSANDPAGWAWTFGDGHTSTEQNPAHTYTQPGNYTITLTVSNAFGSDTLTEASYISVTEPATPVPYFSASPRSGFVPLTVAFEDRSAGGPTGWAWGFGDGGSSTQQHPSHTYTAVGSYTVTLTVSNTLGSDTRTLPAYITVMERAAAIYLPVVLKRGP